MLGYEQPNHPRRRTVRPDGVCRRHYFRSPSSGRGELAFGRLVSPPRVAGQHPADRGSVGHRPTDGPGLWWWISLPPSSIWPRECREPLLLCGSPLPSLSPSFARCSSNRLPPPGSLPLSAPGPQSGWVGEFVDRGCGPCLRDRDESECSLPPSHTRRAISENQYRIVAGDNLWQIAHRILSQFLPHPPTNQQIAGYWMDLIEANEVTLRSGDPNLIHPGETIILSEIRESAQPPLPA